MLTGSPNGGRREAGTEPDLFASDRDEQFEHEVFGDEQGNEEEEEGENLFGDVLRVGSCHHALVGA